MLEKIFSSKTRVKILTLFCQNINNEFYIREIAKTLNINVNGVRRELNNLESIGFLKSHKVDRLKYYKINKQFSIFEEIVAIFKKVEGFEIIKEKLEEVDGIDTAFIYGTTYENINIFLVGEIEEEIIVKEIEKVEKRILKRINFSLHNKKEIAKKIKVDNAPIKEILKEPKKFIIGEYDTLIG